MSACRPGGGRRRPGAAARPPRRRLRRRRGGGRRGHPLGLGPAGPGRGARRGRIVVWSTTPPARWPRPDSSPRWSRPWPRRRRRGRPAPSRCPTPSSGWTPGTTCSETSTRQGLVAVQTPRRSRAAVLRRAHPAADEATDDAGLVEALGATVRGGAGGPEEREAHHARRPGLRRAPAPGAERAHRPGRRRPPPSPTTRTGRWCWAAWCSGRRGLAGHSDADASAHALADAAARARPAWATSAATSPTPTRPGPGPTAWPCWPRWWRMVGRAGLAVANADCTVVAETPRLAPHTDEMAARLSRPCGAPVSVKATRAEGLGAIGPGRGGRLPGGGPARGPRPGPARP